MNISDFTTLNTIHTYRSPNYDKRTGEIDMIVLHATNMPCTASLERLCNPLAKVSAHYVVDEMGTIYQLVDEEKRAWHAGVSYWRGRESINNYSMGIEVVNPNHLDPTNKFSAAQMKAVLSLCKYLIAKYQIPHYNIVAHSDIAPERKDDPGEFFDWSFLAKNGVGCYPEQITTTSHNFTINKIQQTLNLIGYNLPVTNELDQATMKTIIAFKRRYCPLEVNSIISSNFCSALEQIMRKLSPSS